MTARPWHLHDTQSRCRVLENLDEEAAWQACHYPGANDQFIAALRSAAALLRAAEPDYPDDCPAFAVDLGAGEQHVEICDIGITDAAGRTWVTLTAPYGWREPVDCVISALRPLTIAAAEMLDAMGAGS